MMGRNPMLVVTATLLAATLQLALPNLHAEVPSADESFQAESVASPEPMKHEIL